MMHNMNYTYYYKIYHNVASVIFLAMLRGREEPDV